MKKSLLFFLSTFIFSCSGASPIAPTVDTPYEPFSKNNNFSTIKPNTSSSSLNSSDFSTKLKNYNISLSLDEREILQKYQSFYPEGRWEYSENMTPKDVLENNFRDYSPSFKSIKFNSSADYMESAVKFAKSTNFYAKFYLDTLYYQNKKKLLVIKWDPQTKEFLVIHLDSRISNYQFVENISPTRYIEIPEKVGTNNGF